MCSFDTGCPGITVHIIETVKRLNKYIQHNEQFFIQFKNHIPFIPLHDPGTLDADPDSNQIDTDFILIRRPEVN